MTPQAGTATINIQINIDPRMPADKVDYIFECMDKHIFAPQRADTQARNVERTADEGFDDKPQGDRDEPRKD